MKLLPRIFLVISQCSLVGERSENLENDRSSMTAKTMLNYISNAFFKAK